MNERKSLKQQHPKESKRMVKKRAEGLVSARGRMRMAKDPDFEVKGKFGEACVR